MLHIIQNDHEVPPGNLLDHLAIPYTVHHPYRGDILPEQGDISALIVMGGARGANDDARYPFLPELKIPILFVRTFVKRQLLKLTLSTSTLQSVDDFSGGK